MEMKGETQARTSDLRHQHLLEPKAATDTAPWPFNSLVTELDMGSRGQYVYFYHFTFFFIFFLSFCIAAELGNVHVIAFPQGGKIT